MPDITKLKLEIIERIQKMSDEEFEKLYSSLLNKTAVCEACSGNGWIVCPDCSGTGETQTKKT